MPSRPTLRPAFVRIRRQAPAGLFAAATLPRDADPARAGDILPTLTSFTVSATSVDYRMDISFAEADLSCLAALQSQLVASGWPYHVRASVTAAPAPPTAPTPPAASATSARV